MSSGAVLESSKAQEYWEIEPDGPDDIGNEAAPLDRVPAKDFSTLRASFDQLADELVDEASVLSSTRRARNLPVFREILELGEDVIPLVMERMEKGQLRPVWMRLLSTMTTFEPSAGAETIDESARRWVRWSKLRELNAGGP